MIDTQQQERPQGGWEGLRTNWEGLFIFFILFFFIYVIIYLVLFFSILSYSFFFFYLFKYLSIYFFILIYFIFNLCYILSLFLFSFITRPPNSPLIVFDIFFTCFFSIIVVLFLALRSV